MATLKLPHEGHALSISKGVDRDRAVDESGNQLAVFGRVRARPLNLAEQQKLYLRPDGRVWNVQDLQRDFQILDPREREEEYAKRLIQVYGPRRPFVPNRAPRTVTRDQSARQ